MNDLDTLRRKYRIAINAIWLFAFLVLAVSVWAVIAQVNSFSHEDQLVVLRAETETGQCGSKRIVVIDAKRIAIAGQVVGPEDVNSFGFEEKDNRLSAFKVESYHDGTGGSPRQTLKLLWTRDLKR